MDSTFRMEIYRKYKYENVAIYAKKHTEEEDVNEHITGKIDWMKFELEDFGVNIIEFVDSHIEGDYKEINRLIELVKQGEIKAILIWDFDDIEVEIIKRLVEECTKKDVYINGFLTVI